MDNAWKSVKVISFLLGLSGAVLTAGWLFYYWPLLLLVVWADYFLLPFFGPIVSLPYTMIMNLVRPLAIAYGVAELIIAWAMWKKKEWSRIALIALAGAWILLSIYSLVTLKLDYHDPIVFHDLNRITLVAHTVIGTVIIWHLSRKNVKAYFRE